MITGSIAALDNLDAGFPLDSHSFSSVQAEQSFLQRFDLGLAAIGPVDRLQFRVWE